MFEATPNNTIKLLKQSKKVHDIFTLLEIDAAVEDIDLHMTPIDTFGLFESRGDIHRVRSYRERYYFFYIATGKNWQLSV